MDWSIGEKTPPLKNGSKRCERCLTEKYHIIFQKFDLLNQIKELLNKCQHRNKFLLCNFKDESLIAAATKGNHLTTAKRKLFHMASQTEHDFMNSGSFELRLSSDDCLKVAGEDRSVTNRK